MADNNKTAKSGNWSSASTWTPSGVPGTSSDIIIPVGVTVKLDVDASCRNLLVCNGNGTAKLEGPRTLNVQKLTISNNDENNKDATFIIETGATLVCMSIEQIKGKGSVKLSVNGTLKNSGSTSNLSSFTCGNTSIVEYNGNERQNIHSTRYVNLVLSGNGKKSIGNGTSVAGSFSFDSQGTTIAELISGAQIKVNKFKFGGYGRAIGTWGSSKSNAVNKKDEIFDKNASGLIIVEQESRISPEINWIKPADIVAGTALSAQQLNATANVEGTFVYNPSAGTKLNPGQSQNLTTTFQPADASLYQTVTKSAQINVTGTSSTTITWVGGHSNGTTQTNWDEKQNWNPTTRVPLASDDVIIPNVTYKPIITTTAICNSITIEANSSLTIGSGGSLSVSGNWSNSGTFNAGTGTVTFSGNSTNGTQTVSGNTTFYNLTLNNSGATTNFGTSTVTIGGTLSKTTGSMEGGTSTIKFTGTASAISGDGAKEFYHLEITSGTVSISGGNITVKGNFTNNGTFSQGAGVKTTFSGSGSHSISGSGATTLGSLDVTGENTVEAGTHNLTISGTAFDVTGTFNGGTATVTLSGSATLSGSGTYNFNNLMLSGTGNKTIAAGKSVTVNGTLTTGDKLVVESDASLIVKGTSSGKATYNRSLSPTRWTIISAPVQATGFESNAGRLYEADNFATYSESSNNWYYVGLSGSTSLTSGQGYLISIKSPNTGVSFTGLLNDVNVTKGVTSSAGNGWNAVGNPYTSAIGVRSSAASTENFLNKNSGIFKEGYAAIYVWNQPDNNDYDGTSQYYKAIGNSGYTPPSEYGTLSDNYIQAGQGFMINAKTAGNVEFTKDMQAHQTGISLKDAEISWPGITLLAETKGQKRSTAIGFNENMTAGLDVTYDAGLLPTDPFQVYTHLVSGDSPIDFNIQCLPDQFSGVSIPVGVDLPDGGEVIFKTSGVILPTGYFPVLEDRLLKTNTPLREETDTYKVTLDKNTKGTGRFYLSVAQTALASNTFQKEKSFRIYQSNGTIVIAGAVDDAGLKAHLFDISGRKLTEYPLQKQNRNEINLRGLTPQVFLLMIEGKNYRQVEKISVIN